MFDVRIALHPACRVELERRMYAAGERPMTHTERFGGN
jgi:hypothetical protein